MVYSTQEVGTLAGLCFVCSLCFVHFTSKKVTLHVHVLLWTLCVCAGVMFGISFQYFSTHYKCFVIFYNWRAKKNLVLCVLSSMACGVILALVIFSVWFPFALLACLLTFCFTFLMNLHLLSFHTSCKMIFPKTISLISHVLAFVCVFGFAIDWLLVHKQILWNQTSE